MSNWLQSIFGGKSSCEHCDHCDCEEGKEGHKDEKSSILTSGIKSEVAPVENVKKAQ